MKFKVRIAVIMINIVTMFFGLLFSTVTVKDRMKLATANPLEKNKYKEINELAQKYVDAKQAEDYEKLAECVNNIEDCNKEEIKKATKYIKSVKNVTCYTIDGYYDNTYVVFIYQENVWKDIDVVMPMINQYYVCEYKGKLVIFSGTVGNSKKTEKIKKYNDLAQKNPEFVKLRKEVDAEVLALIKGNEILSKLYDKTTKKDDPATDAPTPSPGADATPVPTVSADPKDALG